MLFVHYFLYSSLLLINWTTPSLIQDTNDYSHRLIIPAAPGCLSVYSWRSQSYHLKHKTYHATSLFKVFPWLSFSHRVNSAILTLLSKVLHIWPYLLLCTCCFQLTLPYKHHWPIHWSLNTPGKLLSQCLCTSCCLCLESFAFRYPRDQLQYLIQLCQNIAISDYLHIVYGRFHDTMVELSSCDRVSLAHKP